MMKFPISLHLSILAFSVALCATAHGDEVQSPQNSTSCPDRSKDPAPACADQACAARAKKEMDAQLECHKKRMVELQVAPGSGK